jgi:hypothetical protein
MVKTFGIYIAAVAAIVVIATLSWFGLKQHRRRLYRIACREHNAAFQRQLESIEKDAHEQLKVGTTKGDVSRFFAEHGMPLVSTRGSEPEVSGILHTTACAPPHCGEGVLIRVQAKADSAGTITTEPTVDDLYDDCP